MTNKLPNHPAGTVCDFCNSPLITWAYPCESFSMGVGTQSKENLAIKTEKLLNSWGGWASCDTCHDLIEAGKDRELADRSANQNREVLSEGLTEPEFEMLSAMLFTMHEQFRAGRKGPAIAWKPGDPMPGPLGPPDGPWAEQPEGHWVRK
jgi:hypothetical protein